MNQDQFMVAQTLLEQASRGRVDRGRVDRGIIPEEAGIKKAKPLVTEAIDRISMLASRARELNGELFKAFDPVLIPAGGEPQADSSPSAPGVPLLNDLAAIERQLTALVADQLELRSRSTL